MTAIVLTNERAILCPHCACFDRKALLYRELTKRGPVLRCFSCGGEWTDRREARLGPFMSDAERMAGGIFCEGETQLARVYPFKCVVHRYGECLPMADITDAYKPVE